MKFLKKIIKEPFFLFLILGVVFYLAYTSATNFFERKNRTITVNKTQISLLQESFTKTWNRPPREEELKGQIDYLVMDEIFFKEAVALGLDKTDPAVKRRLRQIMELMLDEYAPIYPTENQLRKYLNENPDKFKKDPIISFRHLYFPYEEKDEADRFLSALKKDSSYEKNYKGDLLMIPSEFESESSREITRFLGNDFSNNVFSSENENWFGPVQSAYGFHLVKVNQIIKGEVPDLNEIWDLVESEWTVDRKKEMKEQQYKMLKEQYEVNIENI